MPQAAGSLNAKPNPGPTVNFLQGDSREQYQKTWEQFEGEIEPIRRTRIQKRINQGENVHQIYTIIQDDKENNHFQSLFIEKKEISDSVPDEEEETDNSDGEYYDIENEHDEQEEIKVDESDEKSKIKEESESEYAPEESGRTIEPAQSEEQQINALMTDQSKVLMLKEVSERKMYLKNTFKDSELFIEYGPDIRGQIKELSRIYWKIPRKLMTEYIATIQTMMQQKKAAMALANPLEGLIDRHSAVCRVHEPLSAYRLYVISRDQPHMSPQQIRLTSFDVQPLKRQIRRMF